MSDELFQLPESLSPRQQWIEDHKITVKEIHVGGTVNHVAGYRDLAESALDKDDALHRLAVKMAHTHDIKHWGAR